MKDSKYEQEHRPRMTDSELHYLVKALEDREEALEALYQTLVRKTVLAAVEDGKWESRGHRWSDTVFRNYEIYGKKALLFFRAGHGWRNRALDKELRINKTALDGFDRELSITKSLRHRFQKLLAGKRRGRLDTASGVARVLLQRDGGG